MILYFTLLILILPRKSRNDNYYHIFFLLQGISSHAKQTADRHADTLPVAISLPYEHPSARQPVSPSALQPARLSARQPFSLPPHQPVSPSSLQPVSPSAHHPISLSARQPATPSALQPVSLPPHQPFIPSPRQPFIPSVRAADDRAPPSVAGRERGALTPVVPRPGYVPS